MDRLVEGIPVHPFEMAHNIDYATSNKSKLDLVIIPDYLAYIMMKDDVGLLHKLVRTYTFNSPINRGKYRLSDLGMKFSKELQGEITVETSDGRDFIVDTSNSSYRYVYFLGSYEPVITGIFSALVGPGDVCLDVGANIGWYATLFQKLVGEKGEVHAFEPVPPIFEHLRRNVEINEPPYNVRLNDFALGDVETDVELHIFPS